jgi:uridine phosphorylase
LYTKAENKEIGTGASIGSWLPIDAPVPISIIADIILFMTIFEAPILEFDSTRSAILEPTGPTTTRPVPERAVLCFFQEVIDALMAEGRLEKIGALRSEIGHHPLYILEEAGLPVLVAHPLVGAPLAAAIVEELIWLGVNRFIACGGCGVLRPDIAAGHPVILTSAVRDEGTSYHYLPAGREVAPGAPAVAALEAACQKMNIDYRLGKTWTTDAIYRETIARRERRILEGCDVVEMEASAFFAVAQFRGVTFGQVVYGGDLVVPEGWDRRGWNDRMDDRRLMFRLALEAARLT